MSKYRKVFSTDKIKKILSYQKHVNFSLNDKQFNILLTIQGFVLHNFMNFYFLRDMRLKDLVDSNNIEYNNPFSRERIREYNREKDNVGVFYDRNFRLSKFVIELLERFFPKTNGIWADYHHFTHVKV